MKGRQIKYSPEELKFVKRNKKLPRKKLHQMFCEEFGRKDVGQKNLSALCKRKGWLTGRTGNFEKKQVPWNLGKTGYMGPNRTTFKKGNRPKNWRPVGSERILSNGYVEIKIKEPNTWKLKHVKVWENATQSVPENHIIIFLDGNKENCCIDNLAIISRRVNAYINQNGFSNLRGEEKKAAITLARLEGKISSSSKNQG